MLPPSSSQEPGNEASYLQDNMDKLVAMATVEVNTAYCASVLSRWHYTLYLQGGHTLAPSQQTQGCQA